MPFSGTPIIGQFYIQKENQDFWLYEAVAGVPQWVRKGNIRDEGTSGLVNVPPLVAHGFDMEVVSLDRWRYVPDATTPILMSTGFDEAVAALELTRYLPALVYDLSVMSLAPVDRIKPIAVALSLGFDVTTPGLDSTHYLLVPMSLGFTQDSNFTVFLAASMGLGFGQLSPVTKLKAISAAMAYGYSQSTAISKWFNLTPAQEGVGFGMAVTLTHSVPQPTTSPVLVNSTAGGSTAASYTNPITSGNGEYMVLVAHRCFTTAGVADTITSVTDARGNTWTRIGNRKIDGTSHQTMELWGARNNGAGGSFNITINWGSAGDRGSSVASSYSNVNTASPTAGTAPVFSVNDTATANLPTVAATAPFTHCRLVAAFGSTEDLAGNTPDNITGYGGWESVNSSFSGTGTTASKVVVSDVDDQTTSGAVTVKDSLDSMRFYIWGVFFLKGT